MTVKQFLINHENSLVERRLERLKEIQAPEIMVTNLESQLANFEAEFKLGGSTGLLECEYISHEVKKGNGGKTYITINGNINYFPNAQYGRFIKEAK